MYNDVERYSQTSNDFVRFSEIYLMNIPPRLELFLNNDVDVCKWCSTVWSVEPYVVMAIYVTIRKSKKDDLYHGAYVTGTPRHRGRIAELSSSLLSQTFDGYNSVVLVLGTSGTYCCVINDI